MILKKLCVVLPGQSRTEEGRASRDAVKLLQCIYTEIKRINIVLVQNILNLLLI